MKKGCCPGKALLIFGAMVFTAICLSACHPSTAHEQKVPEKTKIIAKTVTCISENEVIFLSGFLEADKTVPLSFMVPGKVNQIGRAHV